LVSYADENQGHRGYIYQATNWIYTGRSAPERKFYIDGKEVHRRTLNSRYGTGSVEKLRAMGHDLTFDEQVGKHRYFQVVGNKRDRKYLQKIVIKRYGQKPYPKGDNIRYDAGENKTHVYDKWAGIF